MVSWDSYQDRIATIGTTRRGTALQREQGYLSKRIRDSLSYQVVDIDGVEQEVALIDSDNLDIKFAYSLPGETIRHGSLISWENNHWLVIELDAHREVYTRAKLQQCNHLLKWMLEDGTVHEQWCYVEDGTKYLTGEMEDRYFVVTRGDSRIAVTIAKNEYSVKLDRTSRFLIDDPDSPIKLSYQLTKPLKMNNVFENVGVFKFVLSEVNSTIYDDMENGIADYYKYHLDEMPNLPDPQAPGARGWL